MKQIVTERRELSFARMDPGLDGLRIVQISDLHLSGRPGRFERRLAEKVAEERPDILVFTGDTVNHKRSWSEALDWLRDLPAETARLAVPGNWDYHAVGIDAFCRGMREAGLVPLVNQRIRIHPRGIPIDVVGFDDVFKGHADIPEGADASRDGALVLALCHSPDVLLQLHPSRFDLLLCGHTHGGQIRLPRYGALITSTRIGKRYEAGLYEPLPGHYVYVSRGVGEGPIKIRFRCPPELARFTLRSIVASSRKE